MARATGDTSRVVTSAVADAPAVFGVRAYRRGGGWHDYVTAVLAALVRRGVDVPELDIAIWGEVPQGAGLSSSAALEVATVWAACALAGEPLDPLRAARDAHVAEHDLVGVPCGIMDQFACALGRSGHAVHVRCDEERVALVPFSQSC